MLKRALLSLSLLLLLPVVPAQANVTERIWEALERSFGLTQVTVAPHDVQGPGGRIFPPERQVMVTLQAGELLGDSARADLFSLVTHWLNRAYPRSVIPLQAANGVGFSRAWEIAANEFATRHHDSTVTQFALLIEQEIQIVETAQGFVARLSIDEDSFEIPVHRDGSGEWQIAEGSAGRGNLLAEMRGRFAWGAQAMVFMQDARSLFGRDRHLSEQAAHQFFGRLLGLENASLYVGRPYAGPVGQLVVSQLARRGISRIVLGGLSLVAAAYFAPDAGEFIGTALLTSGLYLAEGLAQRNWGRGHMSVFERGEQTSFEAVRDYTARKALLLQAQACANALVAPPATAASP